MIGLGSSGSGSGDTGINALTNLLAVVSDPVASKARLAELTAKAQEAEQHLAEAKTLHAKAEAVNKEVITKQAKLEESSQLQTSLVNDVQAREAKVAAALKDIEDREAALSVAKDAFAEDCAVRDKALDDKEERLNNAKAKAAAKIKADTAEFQHSVEIQRAELASLLKDAAEKNDAAAEALAEAEQVKLRLNDRITSLRQAMQGGTV